MPTARCLAGTTLVSLIALAAGPAAQSPQAPVFRARVDLVPVYVVAVDEDGTPVMDLTAADFTLRDGGTPQEVSVFDVVRREVPPPPPVEFRQPPDLPRDVASNRALDTDRVVVIVVDDLHMYKNRTQLARDLTVDLIEQLQPGSSMALLLTSGEGSTQVTEDHGRLIDIARTFTARRPVPRPTEGVDPMLPGVWDPETSSGMAHAGINNELQDFFDNMSLYDTLGDAARMLRVSDGRRKAFVVVTEAPGFNLHWLPERTSPCFERPTSPPCHHDAKLLEITTAMRRSNVAMYAVDPRGLVESKDLQRECFPPPPEISGPDPCSDGMTAWHSSLRWAQQGLETITRVNGGFAVTNTDDLAGGLERIRADLDNYYLLGFYPTDQGKGFREIQVSVNRPGLTLRYRQGYDAGAPEVDDDDESDELTALSTGLLPNPDLPLRLYAAPFPGTRRSRVAVTIEVAEPRAEVTGADGRIADELRYSVLAANEATGKVEQHLANTARLTSRAPLADDAPPTVFYQVPMTMELPPGRYQLRASALSEKLARGGSVYLTVDVPDYRNAFVAISGLVVASTLAPPMPVAEGATRQVVPFGPTLTREFARGDTLRVYYEIARRGQIGLDARLEVLNHRGEVVTAVDTPVVFRESGVVDVTLPLTGYTPGAYRLRASAETSDHRAEQVVGFVVR
jgi:VWFA-related protein